MATGTEAGKRLDGADKKRRARRFEDIDGKRASKRFDRIDKRRTTAVGGEGAQKDAPDREGAQDKEGKIIDAVFRDSAKELGINIGALRDQSGQSVVDAVQARLKGADSKSEDYARIINQIVPERRDAVRAAVERQIAKGKSDSAKDADEPKEKSAEELVDDLRALSEKMDKEALEKFLKEPKDFLGNKIERTLTDTQKNFLRSVWEQLLKEDATPTVFDALLKEVAKEIGQDVAGGILRAHNDFLKKERGPLMQQVQELRDDLQAMRAEVQAIRAQQQAPQTQVMPGAVPPYVPRGHEQAYQPSQPNGQWVWQPAPAPQYPPQGMPPQANTQPQAPRTEAAPQPTAQAEKVRADKELADALKKLDGEGKLAEDRTIPEGTSERGARLLKTEADFHAALAQHGLRDSKGNPIVEGSLVQRTLRQWTAMPMWKKALAMTTVAGATIGGVALASLALPYLGVAAGASWSGLSALQWGTVFGTKAVGAITASVTSSRLLNWMFKKDNVGIMDRMKIDMGAKRAEKLWNKNETENMYRRRIVAEHGGNMKAVEKYLTTEEIQKVFDKGKRSYWWKQALLTGAVGVGGYQLAHGGLENSWSALNNWFNGGATPTPATVPPAAPTTGFSWDVINGGSTAPMAPLEPTPAPSAPADAPVAPAPVAPPAVEATPAPAPESAAAPAASPTEAAPAAPDLPESVVEKIYNFMSHVTCKEGTWGAVKEVLASPDFNVLQGLSTNDQNWIVAQFDRIVDIGGQTPAANMDLMKAVFNATDPNEVIKKVADMTQFFNSDQAAEAADRIADRFPELADRLGMLLRIAARQA